MGIRWIMRVAAMPVLLSCMLSGCIGSRSIEAPVEYLSPTGWQNKQQLLEYETFENYAKAVTTEVKRFRLPFNESQAELEIKLVSPLELPLAASCNGLSKGIAILVHGLSDTAFSLRDIGGVLAEACFKSRLVLLPGHGTRAGDLLTTRLEDWQTTLDYLIDQAVTETNTVMLVGFSLGGVLTLHSAMNRENDIDGVIGISPAYYLSSERITKWAGMLAPITRWVDRGVQDDSFRYEAMPTIGIAETWSAIKNMRQTINTYESIDIPWMLAQSMDDAVVAPDKNEQLWKRKASNPNSRIIRFTSTQEYPSENRVINFSGTSETDQVIALSHLAIHQSRENPHYGVPPL